MKPSPCKTHEVRHEFAKIHFGFMWFVERAGVTEHVQFRCMAGACFSSTQAAADVNVWVFAAMADFASPCSKKKAKAAKRKAEAEASGGKKEE